MKRLPAQIGITYFSVLAAAFYLSEKLVFVIGAVSLLLIALSFLVKRIRRTFFLPAMALAVLAACTVSISYTRTAVQPLTERFAGGEHTLETRLLDEPYQSYAKNYYQLETVRIDSEAVKCRVMLKLPQPIDAEPDDLLTFRSELLATQNDYYRAKRYYLTADSYDITVTVQSAPSHRLYYRIIQIRRLMRKALDAYLPEDCAALCRAVLIGDKYALSLPVRDNFRYAGASYFIVISGMHFAVICLLAMTLLKRVNRWARMFIMFGFILFYAAITGFQSSVLRSGLMIAVTVTGNTIRRQAYPLNHLGIAGIVLPCIVSPYGAGDIGLILSFYATMAILLWAEPIARKICYTDEFGNIPQFHPAVWLHGKCSFSVACITARLRHEKPPKKEKREPLDFMLLRHKARNTVCSLLSVSLAANIFIFPLSVLIFHEFSVITLFSALLLYLPIYCIVIFALLLCLLFYLKPIAFCLSWLLYVLCRYVLWMIEFLGSFRYAFVRVSAPYIYVWLGFSALLGIIVVLYRNNYHYLKYAALSSAVILLAGILAHEWTESQKLVLELYPCGDGICADINDGGNLHLLRLDANTKYLYKIMDDLSYRYGSARSALCCQYDELQKYRLYREDEFAISDYLLYDSESNDFDGEKVTSFRGDCLFAMDDDLTLRVYGDGDIAVPYYTAGDKRILIVPNGCMLEDIPDDMRQADIVILSGSAAGVDLLKCDDLIISNTADNALMTADVMQGCYNRVLITGTEKITYPLR